MVVFVLTEGTTVRVEDGAEVLHQPHAIACLDPHGKQIVSFEDRGVAGYTFVPEHTYSLQRLVKQQLVPSR